MVWLGIFFPLTFHNMDVAIEIEILIVMKKQIGRNLDVELFFRFAGLLFIYLFHFSCSCADGLFSCWAANFLRFAVDALKIWLLTMNRKEMPHRSIFSCLLLWSLNFIAKLLVYCLVLFLTLIFISTNLFEEEKKRTKMWFKFVLKTYLNVLREKN